MKGDSYGPVADQEVWIALLVAGGDALTHDLWCAVIRGIARAVLARIPGAIGPNDEEYEGEVEGLVADWQCETCPSGASLIWILGECDYFYNIDLNWDEKMWLGSGKACGYSSDVVDDLWPQLEANPDAQEAVTEELVDDFFWMWRTHFLRRVLTEAQSIGNRAAKE